MKYVLGIDIGGTKIAVCVANENGEILASGRFPSTKTYAEALAKIPSLGITQSPTCLRMAQSAWHSLPIWVT